MRRSFLIFLVIVILIILVLLVLLFDIGREQPSVDLLTPIGSSTPAISVPPETSTTTTDVSAPVATSTSTTTAPVVVTTPLQTISSPATFKGSMVGNWFFEAQASADIRDAHGKVLGQGQVSALSDWMTTNYVPFATTITFATSTTPTGTLVIHKDNPSGDPARDQSMSFPVTFKQ